uniref:HAT C-terminal dimerisation domain-containing protein n=1 Tax=Kwoniella pini CBS 10737 TaxID=1296096 RepID=A0A1B9HVQ4_9TREE|nr:uncharacterized protein I206_06250 [Kwoniella pini CBS 10737]OCF47354.1 hypothetical protein I206_06250 [Kwoniella pini CBS 10737]
MPSEDEMSVKQLEEVLTGEIGKLNPAQKQSIFGGLPPEQFYGDSSQDAEEQLFNVKNLLRKIRIELAKGASTCISEYSHDHFTDGKAATSKPPSKKAPLKKSTPSWAVDGATSVAPERIFSMAGLTVSDRRHALKPATLTSLLCLSSWHKNGLINYESWREFMRARNSKD